MRIYIADDGDTLRTIAQKNDVEIRQLISLNPFIPSIDLNIAGKSVKLPSPSVTIRTDAPLLSCDLFIPQVSLERMAQTDYDVIVVGTGAGGGAAIWRLCDQLRDTGKKIGVVEAGPVLLQTHADNLPILSEQLSFQNVSVPTGNFLRTRLVYALGGRMLYWSLVSPRMYVGELARFPVTLQGMELYYNLAEQIMNVTTRMKPSPYMNPFAQILLTRLWEGGFPEATVGPLASNFEPEKYGSVVHFSSLSFLGEGLKQRPFDLAVNARAVQILTEQGKAAGVKVMTPEKKSYVLSAKKVVLSASAFETPRLLLYSGIEGRAIGHYLTHHTHLEFNFKTSLMRKDLPDTGPVFIMLPQTENRPYQFVFNVTVQILEPIAELEVRGGVFGKVEPRFENKVTLNPLMKDEYGVPMLQVDFSYSEQDEAVMAQMADAVKTFAAVMGASMEPEIQRITGRDYHEAGTCRMGDDPATSATNRFGQIHNVSGLYVADNSVLPSTGAANPTLTTVAMAIRTADHIAQNLR
ncbi:GMC oxidoreductase [Paenibacillus alkaliterrae]|uniref:GMC oxidoreductase n=1 Tax=Paenibacillus alkaliterrae TaxID=320909 RepID=UPI001F20CB7B|nr:GMC oxidoreductase [Paenibacillus alkaliterrae]MCF2937722.1 GMC oxidoreductase [Paenibacillus alkaliterrae]